MSPADRAAAAPAGESAQAAGATSNLPAFGSGWAVFLDIDGTLLDYAHHPGAVVVDEPLAALLGRLLEVTGGALALISGRSVADIERLFAPLALPAAGQHGVERRDAAGRLQRHQLPEDGLRHASARLAQLAAGNPALVFENKGLNLALHYRNVPAAGEVVEREIRALAAELGPQFEAQGGKLVWEIKPSGLDKGTAIEEFMREPPFLSRTPVFIGDDLTDEHGFALVNRLGGHSVKVGAGTSAARWRIADAAAVRDWLGRFAEFKA